MSLLLTIKQNQISARKSKDTIAASLLTTLIGEAEMVGKNAGNRETTDPEVMTVIKKFVKNINETIAVLDASDSRVPDLLAELEILENYLPEQFDQEQLERILGSIKNEINAGPRDMGKMLALLKSRFDGQYDGRLAATVAKSILP